MKRRLLFAIFASVGLLATTQQAQAFFPPIIPQNNVVTQPTVPAPITPVTPPVVVVPPTPQPQIPVTPDAVPAPCDPATPNAVPEPATVLSGLIGLSVVGFVRHTRKRKKAQQS